MSTSPIGRQKQAAQEVEAKRKANEKEQTQATVDDAVDIPMNDETAEAATKIQARFRPLLSCCWVIEPVTQCPQVICTLGQAEAGCK